MGAEENDAFRYRYQELPPDGGGELVNADLLQEPEVENRGNGISGSRVEDQRPREKSAGRRCSRKPQQPENNSSDSELGGNPGCR